MPKLVCLDSLEPCGSHLPPEAQQLYLKVVSYPIELNCYKKKSWNNQFWMKSWAAQWKISYCAGEDYDIRFKSTGNVRFLIVGWGAFDAISMVDFSRNSRNAKLILSCIVTVQDKHLCMQNSRFFFLKFEEEFSLV